MFIHVCDDDVFYVSFLHLNLKKNGVYDDVYVYYYIILITILIIMVIIMVLIPPPILLIL